ncbi:YgjV family protein [Nocardioides coralli]|uniref:YgjV family protein n=1 Tax=Nocardioides coralli TaxID=2872154 RepID=UPI001CA424FF|nr:YgjV family protein [Nocardioides coralli]QZY28030.1 YgjV family protein [Nocardioides coralli]
MAWLADNWLDLFGWAGSALLIVSLLQTRILRFRLLNLAASISLVIFNALVEVWPMVGMNLATTTINLFMIRKLLSDRHDDTAFTVLQVGPQEAYFQHFLSVHADDIRTFHPAYDGTQPDDLAFQVERGDETVGVVLIRREGDVARVQLDYVTPRFRDFSPGEFVWRRAPRLRERGFRRVVTPPRMVSPYYDRLDTGFRREGESYVLEL